MSPQAQNFENICKGGNPGTIKGLLEFQSKSIVKELQDKHGVTDLLCLAMRLAYAK